jgi:hypothetical protein
LHYFGAIGSVRTFEVGYDANDERMASLQ